MNSRGATALVRRPYTILSLMEHSEVKLYSEMEMWTTSGLIFCQCTSGHPIGEHPSNWMELCDDASELLCTQFWVLDRCHDEDEDWDSRHGCDSSGCSLWASRYIR